MSHMAIVEDCHITDIEALSAACQELGLQLNLGQKNWRWYGKWMNDYHGDAAGYKHGVKPEEYGKCADHVITIPGNNRCYEIGVIKRRDGQPGYMLLYDFYSGGYGMSEKVGGPECKNLQKMYKLQAALRPLKSKGFTNYKITQKANGDYQCVTVRKKVQNFK